jgi:hypothetical protein
MKFTPREAERIPRGAAGHAVVPAPPDTRLLGEIDPDGEQQLVDPLVGQPVSPGLRHQRATVAQPRIEP